MFISRRLQGMVLVLIVGVLTFGFMSVVQEATASDSDCGKALDEYARASLEARLICLSYGSDSDECRNALARALYYMFRAIVICMN